MKKRKITRVSRKKKTEAISQGKDILKLTCCKCKKVFEITVNKIEAYTKEVKKKWHCLNCKYKEK